MVNNDIDALERTWSYESLNFDKLEIIDLIPGGRNIKVKEEEKIDYVQKLCYQKMAVEI